MHTPYRPRDVEYRYSVGAVLGGWLRQWVVVMCVVCVTMPLWSCRGYTDEYSGTYVEARGEGINEEILVIDLFRFGDFLDAVVRTYRAPQSSTTEELLTDQISCNWASVTAAPGDDGTFTLEVPQGPDREVLVIEGQLTEGGETLEIDMSGGGSPDVADLEEAQSKTLKLFSESPNNDCEEIRPFLIQPDFDFAQSTNGNRFPSQVMRTITHPVFAVLWLGVRARRVDSSVTIWVAKNTVNPSYYLDERYVQSDRRGLRNSFSLSVERPEERALTESGATRYAFGHFVVIDDDCGDDGCDAEERRRFTWNIPNEPIVAAAVENGVEVSGEPDIVGVGKALLFVEGRLSELGNIKALITNLDPYLESRDSSHFYIVDFLFDDNGNVVEMILPPDVNVLSGPRYRDIPVRVSSEYLDADEIRLPRLVPLEDL